MVTDTLLQRPFSLLGSTVRAHRVQLLWDKGQKDLGRVEEVLGFPSSFGLGLKLGGVRRGGGCHLPPAVFPPPTHTKSWKSQKNPEERP